MKISLALGPRRTLSRQTAWGCLTTNLAMPGFGSLMAGRISGYFQAALAFAGFALTTIGGIRFLAWYLANGARLRGPQADPVAALEAILQAAKWPFAGIALFALGWLWGLVTGWWLVQEAKHAESRNLPPRLG